jgi:sugar phosphate isomerase/epimerase
MLAACTMALPALKLPAAVAMASEDLGSLGLVIHSFPVHVAADRVHDSQTPISDPIRFVDHCHMLGVRSVQVGIGVHEPSYVRALRGKAETDSMHLEGIVALPAGQAGLDRFEAEVRTAKEAGAAVLRTVTLSGRRYETFDSAASFRKFADMALHRLRLAAAVVARHGMLLAVENHKDWRAEELIALLKKAGGDQLGVCLDVGNSISLLEDPMEVVETLAPRAFTTHFKDMAVEEYRDGFLLSEVPLGQGLIDLPRVVQTLRQARAEIRFNIEMITRDPLKVPCLTDRYFATFAELPARHLARTLSMVRSHPPRSPLPRISSLAAHDQMRAEDENVRQCVTYAREKLGL